MSFKISKINFLNIYNKNIDSFKYISIISLDRIIGLVIVYFLIRKISDENFAFWAQVQFLPGLMCGILALGLGRGILRLFVDNKIPQKIIAYTLLAISLTYLIICGMSYLLILLLDNININKFMGGDSNTYFGMMILSIFILFEGFYEILENFLRAKLSYLYLVFLGLKMLPRIIGALFIIIFNFDFWVSINYYLMFSGFIIIPLFFFVFKCIKKYHTKQNYNFYELKSFFIKVISYSFPVLISSLSLPILQIMMRDHIIAENGYDTLGVFSIYLSFIGLLIYFPDSFQNYIFPKLISIKNNHKNLKINENIILKNLRNSLIISISFCVIFVLIGSYLLDTFYPKKNWTIVDAIFISITSFLTMFYRSLEKAYLIYFPHKTMVLSYTLYISLVVALTLLYTNLLDGPLNAILSFMFFFLVSTLIMLIFLKKRNISII